MRSLFFTILFLFCSFSFSKERKSVQTFVVQNTSETSFYKKILQPAFNILKKEPVSSPLYKKQVVSLFSTVHNSASFETLELLSDIYGKKGDFKNQIKILKVATADYDHIPRSHFLLGKAYKELYEKNSNPLHISEAVHYFYKAIKKAADPNKNKKQRYAYKEAYDNLLPLLKNYSQSAYLELAQQMFLYFKKPEHYTELCEAYFKNNLVKQSLSSCRKAMKKNPQNPKSKYFFTLLSRENTKKTRMGLIKLAGTFKSSFFIQSEVGQYFSKIEPLKAISYLKRATKIQPESAKTHKQLAWILFNTGKEEESYESFYQACSLKPKLFLKDIKLAKSKFQSKRNSIKEISFKFNLNLKFKKGIDICAEKLES